MRKELKVDNKCIWCGKWAMVAPNNFTMDYSTLKVVVISQKEILSQDVSKAVQICPVDTISIS